MCAEKRACLLACAAHCPRASKIWLQGLQWKDWGGVVHSAFTRELFGSLYSPTSGRSLPAPTFWSACGGGGGEGQRAYSPEFCISHGVRDLCALLVVCTCV